MPKEIRPKKEKKRKISPPLICSKCFQEVKSSRHRWCGKFWKAKKFENLCNMLNETPRMASYVVNQLLNNFETCPVTGEVELTHFNGGAKTRIYKTLPKSVDLSNKNFIETSMNYVTKYFDSQGLSAKSVVIRKVYDNSLHFSEKLKIKILNP